MYVAGGRIDHGHERFSDDPQGRQIATNDMLFLENALVVYHAKINAHYIWFCSVRRRLRSNAQTQSLDAEESMGLDNLAYRKPTSLLDDEQAISKPHIDPGGHCETLDNANVRFDYFYAGLLCFSGDSGTQSEEILEK